MARAAAARTSSKPPAAPAWSIASSRTEGNQHAHPRRRPTPTPLRRGFFFQAGESLQRLRLESRELGLAAHGHDSHLARAVDRHHHGYLVAALEQRDVADFRAAHRQVEYGPGIGAGIEPDDAVRGPQVAPHPVLAVDRDVIRLHRGIV